jgi:endonuclease/exonuclease/phosphatase family metal-dependent hydrolase
MMMFTKLVPVCMMLAPFAATWDRATDPPAASQPSADTVQLPDRLKVVTFNVQNCSGGADRLIEFLRSQNADLVFLQEVPRPAGKEPGTADRIAKALGNMYVVSAATLNIPARQACDQAILSRLPLRDGRAHALTRDGWVYAMEATIKGHERPLHLFSVHTHSTFHLKVEHIIQSSTTRMAQVSALLDTVRGLDGEVIVAGDFNAAPWMPEYYGVTRLLTDLGTASQDAKLSFPSHKPSVRIDYVFCRGNLAAGSYEVIDSRLSDHRPVVAELERQTPASGPRPQ